MALAIAIGWNAIGLLDFAVAIGISRRFPSAGPGYMISLNTPIVATLKPTILGIVTWGVPLAITSCLYGSYWQPDLTGLRKPGP